MPLVYLGFRPKDSYELHRKFANNKNSYAFHFNEIINDEAVMKLMNNVPIDSDNKPQKYNRDIRPFTGMNPSRSVEKLIFDSEFESGNLDIVVQVDENEFDCYMRVDSNTKGHLNWFYFKVWNAGN